jgi:Na+/proline symporter
VIALQVPQSIFDIATQYAFAGYSGLTPLLVAALFWKGSTKWGALASTLWAAAGVLTVAIVQGTIPAPPPGVAIPVLALDGVPIITREAGGMIVMGFLPVVPMTIVSAMLMWAVSVLTRRARPGVATLGKYFPA